MPAETPDKMRKHFVKGLEVDVSQKVGREPPYDREKKRRLRAYSRKRVSW